MTIDIATMSAVETGAATNAATTTAAAARTTATPVAQFQRQMDALNATLQNLLETPRILSAADKQSIQTALSQYAALNATLDNSIGAMSTNTDIGQITTNIGAYQTKINALKTQLKEVKEEAETSEARKRSVENTEQDVSYHQLYLMDRPLRQLSIPTLFTLSVIFIMGGIYFLYKLNDAPALAQPTAFASAVAPITGLMSVFGKQMGANPTAATTTQAPGQFNKGMFSTIFKNTPKINVSGRGLSEYFK